MLHLYKSNYITHQLRPMNTSQLKILFVYVPIKKNIVLIFHETVFIFYCVLLIKTIIEHNMFSIYNSIVLKI